MSLSGHFILWSTKKSYVSCFCLLYKPMAMIEPMEIAFGNINHIIIIDISLVECHCVLLYIWPGQWMFQLQINLQAIFLFGVHAKLILSLWISRRLFFRFLCVRTLTNVTDIYEAILCGLILCLYPAGVSFFLIKFAILYFKQRYGYIDIVSNRLILTIQNRIHTHAHTVREADLRSIYIKRQHKQDRVNIAPCI